MFVRLLLCVNCSSLVVMRWSLCDALCVICCALFVVRRLLLVCVGCCRLCVVLCMLDVAWRVLVWLTFVVCLLRCVGLVVCWCLLYAGGGLLFVVVSLSLFSLYVDCRSCVLVVVCFLVLCLRLVCLVDVCLSLFLFVGCCLLHVVCC